MRAMIPIPLSLYFGSPLRVSRALKHLSAKANPCHEPQTNQRLIHASLRSRLRLVFLPMSVPQFIFQPSASVMPSTPRSSSPRGNLGAVSVNPRNNTLHPFMPARAVPNVVGPFKVKQANGMIYRGCLGIYRKRLCFSIVPIPSAVRFIEDAPAVARMPTAILDHKRIREAQDFVSVHVRSPFKVIPLSTKPPHAMTPAAPLAPSARQSHANQNRS